MFTMFRLFCVIICTRSIISTTTSEIIDILEEMFLWYYMHSGIVKNIQIFNHILEIYTFAKYWTC